MASGSYPVARPNPPAVEAYMKGLREKLVEFERSAAEIQQWHLAQEPVFSAIDQCTDFTKRSVSDSGGVVDTWLCAISPVDLPRCEEYLQRYVAWTELLRTGKLREFHQQYLQLVTDLVVASGQDRFFSYKTVESESAEENQAKLKAVIARGKEIDNACKHAAKKLKDCTEMIAVYAKEEARQKALLEEQTRVTTDSIPTAAGTSL